MKQIRGNIVIKLRKSEKLEKPGKPASFLDKLMVKPGLHRQKNVYQQTLKNVYQQTFTCSLAGIETKKPANLWRG